MYETLDKLTSDDGEDTLQASFTPNNGIRIAITNEDIGGELAEFDLEPADAIALGEALIRWAKAGH